MSWQASERRIAEIHKGKGGIVGVIRPNVILGRNLRRGSGMGTGNHNRLRVRVDPSTAAIRRIRRRRIFDRDLVK